MTEAKREKKCRQCKALFEKLYEDTSFCKECAEKIMSGHFKKFQCAECRRDCISGFTTARNVCDTCLRRKGLLICSNCFYADKRLYPHGCLKCHTNKTHPSGYTAFLSEVEKLKKQEEEELKLARERVRRAQIELQDSLKMLGKVEKEQKEQGEARVQRRLERQMQGGHQKLPGGGILDVITPGGRIIEIKDWKTWDRAIGQLKKYGIYRQESKLVVHLFGERPCSLAFDEARIVFANEGIEVYEDVHGVGVLLPPPEDRTITPVGNRYAPREPLALKDKPKSFPKAELDENQEAQRHNFGLRVEWCVKFVNQIGFSGVQDTETVLFGLEKQLSFREYCIHHKKDIAESFGEEKEIQGEIPEWINSRLLQTLGIRLQLASRDRYRLDCSPREDSVLGQKLTLPRDFKYPREPMITEVINILLEHDAIPFYKRDA